MLYWQHALVIRIVLRCRAEGMRDCLLNTVGDVKETKDRIKEVISFYKDGGIM
jgi:hypothetical protein